MKELMRTVNPVDLSFAQNLLGQHGIESFVFDVSMDHLLDSKKIPGLRRYENNSSLRKHQVIFSYAWHIN